MLERLAGHSHYCFLDGFSGYNQIAITPENKEKTTFTCSFGRCLENLALVLKRCMETNLVLNWEKCHFMEEQGIVLGHVISSWGIEVDKSKIDIMHFDILIII